MQHPDILKLVETHAHEKDRNWLTMAKALLAERARLRAAIDKIEMLFG